MVLFICGIDDPLSSVYGGGVMTNKRHFVPEIDYAVIDTIACEVQDISQIVADFEQAKGYRRESLMETLNERFDALLDFFLHTFGSIPSSREVRKTFMAHPPLTTIGLCEIEAETIPLVVVKGLITTHRLPIERDNLSNWTEFSRRYNEAVN